jgi:hypothetical protein
MSTYVRPEPGQPTVVTIAGQKLELRFTLGALKRLEKQHGISLLKGAAFGEVMQSPAMLSLLVLTGLQARQPDITQDWLDEQLDAPDVLRMGPYIVYAVSGNWDEKLIATLEGLTGSPERPLPPPNPPPISTGLPSGALEGSTLALLSENSGG